MKQGASVIKIDKKVPMPAASKAAKYPWRAMKVGDSFLEAGASASIRKQASRAGVIHGRKFSCRVEAKGIRVWRTK